VAFFLVDGTAAGLAGTGAYIYMHGEKTMPVRQIFVAT